MRKSTQNAYNIQKHIEESIGYNLGNRRKKFLFNYIDRGQDSKTLKP